MQQKMRVVHIGYKYGLGNTGGAAVAATRLHKALLSVGVESHYVCVYKLEEGINVYELPTHGSVARRIFFLLTKVTRCFWKFSLCRRSIPLNIIPLFGLEKLLVEIKPDIIHIHWINADVLSLQQIMHMAQKMKRTCVIFNLHDFYMINAIEPHPCGDVRYRIGFNSNTSNIIERWMFNRKKRLINQLYNRTCFVCPSEWAAKICVESIIGRGVPVFVVSNLIDQAFAYTPGLCKPHSRFNVLFGAFNGTQNGFKGWQDLVQSLEMLGEKAPDIATHLEVNVFGESGKDKEIAGVHVRFLGPVSDSKTLTRLYHSMDVLAFPSKQETQGMIKIEALLCGLPVIAFNRTACAEGIVNGVTGWIAEDGEISQFADGLIWAYRQWCDGVANRSLVSSYAMKRYASESSLGKILSVYEGMLNALIL